MKRFGEICACAIVGGFCAVVTAGLVAFAIEIVKLAQ